MHFTQLELLQEQTAFLKSMIYPQKVKLSTWNLRSATYTVPVKYENYTDWTTISVGDQWDCHYDKSYWFETDVTIPQDFAGKRVVLELDFGGEGIVSINGELKSSLCHYWKDGGIPHRTRVDVTDCAKGGEKLHISAQMNLNYKDYFKGHAYEKYDGHSHQVYIFNQASLCALDADAEGLWFDTTCVLETIKRIKSPAGQMLYRTHLIKLDANAETDLMHMNRMDYVSQRMIELLQQAFLCVPFFGPEADVKKGIVKARKVLKKGLKDMPQYDNGTVMFTGYAHMDLVWLWQEKHTVRKVANLFRNALELIARYPDYIFSCSQPYAFQMMEEHYPELFEEIRAAVKSGRIDLVGNPWVEMDGNVTGGEAIVRQMLYGRAYYLEKFGKDSKAFYMPDSFGFPGSMPQIIKRSGVDYFYTSKLGTNEGWHFPHTIFHWQGIDGTYLPRVGYNGHMNATAIDRYFSGIEDKRLLDTVYGSYGYGDGGGGPDYRHCERMIRFKEMPGLPKVKAGTIVDFFKEQFTDDKEFPVWNDELYLDRHRGVLTSGEKIKKQNRKAELLLRKLEMAAVMAEQYLGMEYPMEEIEKLWKMVLHVQFHDSLPGSSITPVNTDVYAEHEAFFEKANALFGKLTEALTASVPHKKGESVRWNFLPWEVDGIPAMGWTVEAKKAAKTPVKATKNTLENQFVKVKIDRNGHISSVYFKELEREALAKPSNTLEIYTDISKNHLSAWDIHPEFEDTVQVLNKADSVELVEGTDEKAVIRVVKTYNKSTITQDITLYDDSARIDVITNVDWQEDMRMLKACFYPDVTASKASYEIQFGAIERPTHKNTEYDAVRFEACCHKWFDLSQGDFGVSVLNDCKYGCDVHDGKMRLSLLRSPLEPDYTLDRGHRSFTYSLYPHAGTWAQGGTVQEAFKLNGPADSITAAAKNETLSAAGSFVTTEGSVVLDTLKKAEDGKGYIVRLYEGFGGGGKATLRFCKELAACTECNLMEQDETEIKVKGNEFNFFVRPYEIRTFRVQFKEN